MPRFFCFGLGFVGQTFARYLKANGWFVVGTTRTPEKRDRLRALGFDARLFDGESASPKLAEALRDADAVLVTIPPRPEAGDGVLAHFRETLVRHTSLRWIGYLSTTGVYGDHAGEWVNEETSPNPVFPHQRRRLEAEQAWRALHACHALPLHLFRLSGIYGPGRNPLLAVQRGTAKRIVHPGAVFGRVHVADVAAVLAASLAHPNPGRVYNVCDDYPAPPAEVTEYACRLLGVLPPPETTLQEAALSEMGRSFYLTRKRVRNARIKQELGINLRFPDYRAGLDALYREMTHSPPET